MRLQSVSCTTSQTTTQWTRCNIHEWTFREFCIADFSLSSKGIVGRKKELWNTTEAQRPYGHDLHSSGVLALCKMKIISIVSNQRLWMCTTSPNVYCKPLSRMMDLSWYRWLSAAIKVKITQPTKRVSHNLHLLTLQYLFDSVWRHHFFTNFYKKDISLR